MSYKKICMVMLALMQTKFGTPGHVNKILRPIMCKNWTNLNRYVLIITDIDKKWFLIFEHTNNHVRFGYVRLLHLIFLVFSYFFSVSSAAIYF